jgi:hypothetical protein
MTGASMLIIRAWKRLISLGGSRVIVTAQPSVVDHAMSGTPSGVSASSHIALGKVPTIMRATALFSG